MIRGSSGVGFSEQDGERQQDHKSREGQERHPIGIARIELVPHNLYPIHRPDQGGDKRTAVADTIHNQTLTLVPKPRNLRIQSNCNNAQSAALVQFGLGLCQRHRYAEQTDSEHERKHGPKAPRLTARGQ